MSLFYVSPRPSKEESSERSSVDDNNLNLQYNKHVKGTKENGDNLKICKIANIQQT